MDKYAYISNSNPAVIEELHSKYKENPENVDEKWRAFFDGFDFWFKCLVVERGVNRG